MTAVETSRTSPTRSAEPACVQATGRFTKRAKTASRKDTGIALDNKGRCQSPVLYDLVRFRIEHFCSTHLILPGKFLVRGRPQVAQKCSNLKRNYYRMIVLKLDSKVSFRV